MKLFRVVATVALYRKTEKGFEFLVVRRAPHLAFMPGRWTIPGGGIEEGDFHATQCEYHVVQEGVRRELREEIGASVVYGALEFLCTFGFHNPRHGHVIGLSFFAKWVAGEPVLEDKENDAFMWVTATEAKAYDFIEDIQGELDSIDRRLA